MISHDRYLIERIADSTYALFGDGTLSNLPGGISQYLEQRAAMDTQTGPLDLGEKSEDSEGAVPAKQPGLSSQEQREIRKQMKALERKIATAEKRASELESEIATMSGEATPDFEAIGAKTQELQRTNDGRDELEMEWLELGEKLEH